MRRLGLVLWLVLLPCAAQAQITAIFTMDLTNCNSGTPTCGASETTETGGGVYTKTFDTGNGPGGILALKYTYANVGAGQNNLGIRWNGIALPSQGQTRYVRLWFKIHSGFNAPSSHWGNKIMIMGAGADDTQRLMIIGAPRFTDSDFAIKCSVNIGGFPDAAEGMNVSIGTWHALQMKITSGTTGSSTDGRIDCYLDNDTSGSPSASTGTMTVPINVSQWDDIQIGAFADNIGAGDTVAYSFTCVEYDDAFDSSWYNAGVPTSRCGGAGGGGGAVTTAGTHYRSPLRMKP